MESQWNWLDDVVLLIVVGMIVSAWFARRCEGFEMLFARLLSGEKMVVDSFPICSPGKSSLLAAYYDDGHRYR